MLGIWTVIIDDHPQSIEFGHLEVRVGADPKSFAVHLALNDRKLASGIVGDGSVFAGEAHANRLKDKIVFSVLRTGGVIKAGTTSAPGGYTFYRAWLDQEELKICPFFELFQPDFRTIAPRASESEVYGFRLKNGGVGLLTKYGIGRQSLAAALEELNWSQMDCARPIRLAYYPVWN